MDLDQQLDPGPNPMYAVLGPRAREQPHSWTALILRWSSRTGFSSELPPLPLPSPPRPVVLAEAVKTKGLLWEQFPAL